MLIIEYIIAIINGLICAAPRLSFNIPVVINSFYWLYVVMACGLFAFFFSTQKVHWSFKAILIYLFVNAFLSEAPALSFNAFILFSFGALMFLIARNLSFSIILKTVEAVFWFEIVIVIMQHFKMDTLMSFHDRMPIMLGSVMQPMRLASMFAILTPFLLFRSRFYIIPLIIMSICSETLGFSLALACGCVVYGLIRLRHHFWKIVAIMAVFGVFVCYRSWTHIYVEAVEGRLPVWILIVKSWMFDTWVNPYGKPDIFGIAQSGPFNLRHLIFGHGTDTFLHLFPIYKSDPNPFPQAHNDFLQVPWETGIIGFSLMMTYITRIMWLLKKHGEDILFSGGVVVLVNMFFAFPMRQTQCMWMLILLIALCEKQINFRRELCQS